jgi:hypothetical protein
VTFTAKYDGRCSSCSEVISAGEQLEWTDDQAVHRDCLADAEAKEAARPTCPKCWMTISVSGACGCDPE